MDTQILIQQIDDCICVTAYFLPEPSSLRVECAEPGIWYARLPDGRLQRLVVRLPERRDEGACFIQELRDSLHELATQDQVDAIARELEYTMRQLSQFQSLLKAA